MRPRSEEGLTPKGLLESEYSLSKCSAERVAMREASAHALQVFSPNSLCISLTRLRKPSYGFPRRGSIFARDKAGFGV